ncbi:MAG: glycosyltransferase family 2 protein [Prevotella sp.]|jgi:glycosyltransferase involved in cell wall biosynthesis
MLISFIIPLYNCANYILDCLNSIYASNLELDEFEVIVVNDGSQDGGNELVSGFASSHSNLHLVNRSNSGASAARNAGLEVANGKWIWFVDADDLINSTIFDNMEFMNCLQNGNADVVAFNYEIESYDSAVEKITYNGVEKITGLEYLKENSRLYLWNKVFSRRAIRNVKFVEGTKNLEDFYFNIQVLSENIIINCFPIIGYKYNNSNIKSTSRNRSESNLRKLSEDTQTIFSLLAEDIKSTSGSRKKVLQQLLNFSSLGYLYSLFSLYSISSLKEGMLFLNKIGCYPIAKIDNFKASAFRLLVNNKYLFFLAKYLKNIF